MIDASMFNFDAMKEEVGNPFEQQADSNRNGPDPRFYTLTKDKDGNGAALIRFLPDSEKGMIQRLNRLSTTVIKNGKKRFVTEFSPATIGLPCPFQEKWQELWNAGDKEGAKLYGRGQVYVTNIKVLKDPAKPENEGKIFWYAMSGKMKDKVQAAVNPSPQDRELGAQPKELFNPLSGNSFRLVAKKGANGQINYDSSEVINEVTSIYNSVDEALEDIKNNTLPLSDLMKPEFYKSYEELQSKMKWVTFSDMEPVQAVQAVQAAPTAQALTAEVAPVQPAQPEVNSAPVQPVQPVQPAQTAQVAPVAQPAAQPESSKSDLDDLLKGLV